MKQQNIQKEIEKIKEEIKAEAEATELTTIQSNNLVVSSPESLHKTKKVFLEILGEIKTKVPDYLG